MSKTFYESLSHCLNAYGADCFLCRSTTNVQPIFFSVLGTPKMYAYSRATDNEMPSYVTDVFILCEYCRIEARNYPSESCAQITTEMHRRIVEKREYKKEFSADFKLVAQGLEL